MVNDWIEKMSLNCVALGQKMPPNPRDWLTRSMLREKPVIVVRFLGFYNHRFEGTVAMCSTGCLCQLSFNYLSRHPFFCLSLPLTHSQSLSSYPQSLPLSLSSNSHSLTLTLTLTISFSAHSHLQSLSSNSQMLSRTHTHTHPWTHPHTLSPLSGFLSLSLSLNSPHRHVSDFLLSRFFLRRFWLNFRVRKMMGFETDRILSEIKICLAGIDAFKNISHSSVFQSSDLI